MTGLIVANLIPVLQTAIGPVILISGVGLLLLTMTNRFGRIVDRTRILNAQLDNLSGTNRETIVAEVAVLWRRARLVRLAIFFASMSALSAALLIIVIFIMALLRIEYACLLCALFVICMISLIASLLVFIRDINRSLAALKIELASKVRTC